MSEGYVFDSANVLGTRLGLLGAEETLRIAGDLCRAVMDCEGEFHGNIHPDNISLDPFGAVGLGPKSEHEPGTWTTDELEYMAPELFWNGDGDATVDVYSIGLLLYAGVSEGRLPFFDRPPHEMDNELRAAALRTRMNGEYIAIPQGLGDNLTALLKKALAFAPEDRYSGPVEMLAALSECAGAESVARDIFGKNQGELSDVEQMMTGIVAASGAVAEPENVPEDAAEEAPQETAEEPEETVPQPEPEQPEPPKPAPVQERKPQERRPSKPVEYRVDKGFEERVPKKKKKSRLPLLIAFVICALLIFTALIWAGLRPPQSAGTSPSPGTHVFGTPDAMAGLETEPADPAAPTLPVGEGTPQTPTATPIPTPEPVSTYEFYIADYSWTEAAEHCRQLGGHLVTISDSDELDTVKNLANAYGIKLVWVGFYRANGTIVWVNDETVNYYVWAAGEPSGKDTDGTVEDYGMLWLLNGKWVYNDSRNDPIADYPGYYSGKIGYVCEYDP